MNYRVSTQDLVVLVNKKRLPMAEIEKQTGMRRQSIWKRLKNAGILDPRRDKDGAPCKVKHFLCGFCGSSVKRYKRRVVSQDQMKAYCNQVCYAAALAQHPFEEWRHGSRLARAIVAQHFALQPEHIVHHKDGNQRNNDRSNLSVFASNADHMAHHRGRQVASLWDGESVVSARDST